MLVPVIGLLQFGVFTRADRFTYLPQIGVYVALAWGAADVCRSWSYRRSVCGIASALVLTVLMGCAWRQVSFWRDSETLWTHTLACTSRNKLAHNNLGNFLADRERLAEAVAHYRQALAIDPRYVDAHFNLGAALFSQGQYDEAIAQYRQALKIQPDFVLAHNNLGEVLARQGRLDEALAQYRKALEIQPDFVLALNNLGEVLARRGRPDEAISQYHKVLKILPDYVETLKNLAWLLATCPDEVRRNGPEALELAQRANRLCAGRRADVLDTLAAACAESGRFPEALAAAQKALELATQANDRALADALRPGSPSTRRASPTIRRWRLPRPPTETLAHGGFQETFRLRRTLPDCKGGALGDGSNLSEKPRSGVDPLPAAGRLPASAAGGRHGLRPDGSLWVYQLR